VKGEFNEFSATIIDRGVIVKSGLLQAYGYFGCADADTQINFVMPSTTQYIHLYAEIDLSVVPNRFEIKATAMSNSTAYTFRKDNLRTTSNGKYQLQLWQVTLTASTIILTDKRANILLAGDAPVLAGAGITRSGGTAALLFDHPETRITLRVIPQNVGAAVRTAVYHTQNFTLCVRLRKNTVDAPLKCPFCVVYRDNDTDQILHHNRTRYDNISASASASRALSSAVRLPR
jgi:hypothetical protein